VTVANPDARRYYEHEAQGSGWSVRQLDRQIATLAYERTGGAKAPARRKRRSNDQTADAENALIGRLEQFLLEPGSDFAFVARQKRLGAGYEILPVRDWFGTKSRLVSIAQARSALSKSDYESAASREFAQQD